MFSNLESEKHHLIQIIMVGQPELRVTLRQKEMEQFAQRVTVHCHLDGLPRAEVGEYIRYRLKVGGATNLEIFTEDAMELISEQSRGIPRLINIICDSALVFGYADGLKVIDKSVIETVVKSREAGGLFTNDLWDEPRLPPSWRYIREGAVEGHGTANGISRRSRGRPESETDPAFQHEGSARCHRA